MLIYYQEIVIEVRRVYLISPFYGTYSNGGGQTALHSTVLQTVKDNSPGILRVNGFIPTSVGSGHGSERLAAESALLDAEILGLVNESFFENVPLRFTSADMYSYKQIRANISTDQKKDYHNRCANTHSLYHALSCAYISEVYLCLSVCF